MNKKYVFGWIVVLGFVSLFVFYLEIRNIGPNTIVSEKRSLVVNTSLQNTRNGELVNQPSIPIRSEGTSKDTWQNKVAENNLRELMVEHMAKQMWPHKTIKHNVDEYTLRPPHFLKDNTPKPTTNTPKDKRNENSPEKDNWKTIVPDLLYVYAAYYDEIVREVPVVHIVGMRNRTLPIFNVTCQYTYEDSAATINVTGEMTDMKNENENQVKEYRGVSIYCEVPNADIPVRCTVFTKQSLPNSLKINYSPKYSNQDGSIAVCFAPFYGYAWPVRLIEFIEMTKLLGVSHYVFYQSKMSDSVNRVIEYYVERGEATVLDYDLPYSNRIHRNGQMFTVQNCILYTRGKFNFVETLDPDELILPEKYDKLIDMVRFLDTNDTSGFIFHSSYMCLENQNNKTSETRLKEVEQENGWNAGSLNLNMLLKTTKDYKPCMVKIMRMNKVMMKPWHTIKLTVHYIVRSQIGYHPSVVDERVAVSHHFRMCHHGSHQVKPNICNKLPVPVQHTVTHKYHDQLIYNVVDKIKKLNIL